MSQVRRYDSFDDAACQWARLLPRSVVNTPFQTLDWQRVWMDEVGDGSPPLILGIHDDEQPLGMASLRADGDDITFVGDQDLCDYHDFLILPGRRAAVFRCAPEPP